MVICRNERVGTWSQSKIETNSPVAYFNALLMFPALACSCVGRAMYSTPTSSANWRNAGRLPSSRIQTLSLSFG